VQNCRAAATLTAVQQRSNEVPAQHRVGGSLWRCQGAADEADHMLAHAGVKDVTVWLHAATRHISGMPQVLNPLHRHSSVSSPVRAKFAQGCRHQDVHSDLQHCHDHVAIVR
jgi:hypothetical protein